MIQNKIKRDKFGHFIKGSYVGFGFKKKHKPWNKNKKGLVLDKNYKNHLASGHGWNKGLPMSEDQKKILSKIHKGKHLSKKTEFRKGQFADEQHMNWKGDEVGYHALHAWVARKLGKPKTCEHCEIEGKRMVWANKSHEYKRDLTDWLRLCSKCHHKYDRENGWGNANRKYGLY